MPGPEDFGATKAGPVPAGVAAFHEFLGRILEKHDFGPQKNGIIEEARRRLTAWPVLPTRGTTVVANWGLMFELSFLVQIGPDGMVLRADEWQRRPNTAKPVYCLLLHDQGWVKEYGSWQALAKGLAPTEVYELGWSKILYEDEAGCTEREPADEVLIDYLADHGHPGAPR